jgi:uncharacterized protein (UPF0332 family)
MLLSSRRAARARPADWRTAISRAYYCLYHIFRAVVFYSSGGDDHEKHPELPKHIPADFPDSANWSNKLKSARLERNKADYEPQATTAESGKEIMRSLIVDAEGLLPIARQYLRDRGLV